MRPKLLCLWMIFAAMLATAFGLCGGRKASYSGSMSRPHTLTGEFRRHRNFRSKFLAKDRDVLVYLPPGYDSNRPQRYPVLYLHDGQNLFDGATSFVPGMEWRVDETAQELINAGEIEPLIIVGIYNTGEQRVNEYTPTKDSVRNIGGEADSYGRMIVEELKPMIDREYRTFADRAHTGLGGSSLGGLVSLYLGLRHPQTFGKLAVLSPSVWWDKRMILREVQSLKSKPASRIWLDMGTKEGDRALSDVARLRDGLIKKGWKPGVDLIYFEATDGLHNEHAWGRALGQCLNIFFRRTKTQSKHTTRVCSSIQSARWKKTSSKGTSSSPVCIRKSLGEPSAINFPPRIIPMRSQVRSIKLITCEEINTVRPLARSASMRDRSRRIISTSSPLSGSSKTSTCGEPIIAAASPIFLRIPSE